MTQLPDDPTQVLHKVASTLRTGAQRARSQAGDGRGYLEIMRTAIYLNDEPEVRLILGLIDTWAESEDPLNGRGDLADYRAGAEAISLAADYFRGLYPDTVWNG